MAPIVKDSDAAVPAAPANSPASPASKPGAVQPVALEVPVSINGARTIEGSDKREPFSESTQTVLVFPQGAVIRLAATLAPGQLVFLTNEKTKKEVVCQVVKSKNYRSVTGYVELEFTEAASGFWGMRFPAAPGAGVPAAPRATTAPVAAAPPSAPKPAVPPTQNVAPSKPAAAPPAAIKPETPAVPTAKSVSLPPAPPRPAAAPQISQAQTPVPSQPSSVVAAAETKNDSQPEAPAAPLPLPAIPDISDFLTAAPGSAVPVKPQHHHEEPAAASAEELMQQAAKLQEQLSALLFEKAKTQAPPPVAPPVAEKPAASEASGKILELADLAPKRATPPALPAPHISKVTPIAHKPSATSFDAEEVQIPAWLAPLANNTETKSSASPSALTHESESHTEPVDENQQESESSSSRSHSIQSEMFGAQLLDETSTSPASEGSGKSRTGLYIGVAAALLIAGGATYWYSQQPGNALTGKAVGAPAVTSPATPASTSTPFAAESAAKSQPPNPTANVVASAQPTPSITPAKQTTLSESNSAAPSNTLTHAASKQPSERSRAAAPPPTPEPKKPVVGEVQLARPVVNGGPAARDGAESSPSIDVSQPANGENLSSLAAGHSKEPAAPLPIGGEVKPAQLIKSVPPVYPSIAKSQRVSGSVRIDALIDAYGNVSSVAVLSGPTILHQAALTAVKQWRYQPAELDGKPTSMHLTVTVQFKLQ